MQDGEKPVFLRPLVTKTTVGAHLRALKPDGHGLGDWVGRVKLELLYRVHQRVHALEAPLLEHDHTFHDYTDNTGND